MLYIIATIFGLMIFIGTVIIIKKKQIEKNNYYDAACQILKEEYLTQSLKKSSREEPLKQQKMIYLKICSKKQKQRYVFNPAHEIIIGRAKQNSTIWLPSREVSMSHCRILLFDRQVYLQDLNSSNGTLVKKGWKTYLIESGQSILLETGNKIKIGETIFRVTVFDFQIR